jgi:hypothetical protein
MSPQSGNEVVINVSGKMADGKVASDKRCLESKVFQVLQELLEVKQGVVKGPKSNLEIATIGAKLEDFDFEVGLNVIGFNLKVTGQATVVVQGNRLNTM